MQPPTLLAAAEQSACRQLTSSDTACCVHVPVSCVGVDCCGCLVDLWWLTSQQHVLQVGTQAKREGPRADCTPVSHVHHSCAMPRTHTSPPPSPTLPTPRCAHMRAPTCAPMPCRCQMPCRDTPAPDARTVGSLGLTDWIFRYVRQKGGGQRRGGVINYQLTPSQNARIPSA